MATTYYARSVSTEHYRCGLSLVTREAGDPLMSVFVAGDRTLYLWPVSAVREIDLTTTAEERATIKAALDATEGPVTL
jgi:hypothetical protein